MTTTLSTAAAAYVDATNQHDLAAFAACFADDALVNDAGREFRGIEAIKTWAEKEVIGPLVTFEVLDITDYDGRVMVTTKVEGNYDKTGLPDPLILEHFVTAVDGKISELAIRFPVA